MERLMKRTSFYLWSIIGFMLLLAAACSTPQQPQLTQQSPTQNKTMEPVKDPHTFANTADVVVKHLDLDLNVDFDKKQLTGKSTLQIENRNGAKQLILDTRDLTIQKVTLDKGETETKFNLGDEVKYMGRPLTVDITPETKEVNVYYTTSPQAAALQWLAPSQTAGGKKPFLFTQSEAILARSWVPCQDSPSVRMTYHAKVKTPKDLLAVMSAKNSTQ